MALISTSSAELDYSPCTYGGGLIDCVFKEPTEALAAFRRNENNTEIKQLYLNLMTDMTDDILGQILDIVASSASENLFHLELKDLAGVTKIPQAVQRFPNLQSLYIGHMDGIENVPCGYIVSTKLSSLALNYLSNLKVIEYGAFKGISIEYCILLIFPTSFGFLKFSGNFSNTTISILDSRLTKFDETVFKPLLTNSTATLDIRGSKIVFMFKL